MSLWTAEQRRIPGGVQLHWRRDGQPGTLAEWVMALRDEPQARAALSQTLAQTPYAAIFWESLPLARATAQGPARQDVLDAASLARVTADAAPFAAQLKAQPGAAVVRFENLSGDALLVVPAALTAPAAYPHLAAFTRLAPAAQQDALWAEVGRAAAPFLAQEAPRWLSTAGLGVSWLHVRLDTRPKYYRSAELRRWPPS
jgi:hypothetical protein